MRLFLKAILLLGLFISISPTFAGTCGTTPPTQPKCTQKTCDPCCAGMGGIQYCDSSAGRYVCKNGAYSTCYCSRHAVMDFQHLEGCCLWHGGVLQLDRSSGLLICNDGSFSEVCSIETASENTLFNR